MVSRKTGIAVVVVNWNQKQLTRKCIESLEASNSPLNIFIVDNGSQDGSADFLLSRFSDATVIPLPENIGFGPACNRAVRKILNQTDCEYIFILNNDVEIEPDTVSRLVDEAGENPRAGLWSPKILFHEKRETIWYAGCRKLGATGFPTGSGRGLKDRGQFDQVQETEFVFGAALLVHKSVFKRIGLFDERFFLYMEDLDFSLRATAAGYSPRLVHQARVYHHGSASTRENSSLKYFHLGKSLILYLGKHFHSVWIFPAGLFWLASGVVYLLPELVKGKFSCLTESLKGAFHGVSAHKTLLRSDPPSKIDGKKKPDNALNWNPQA